MSRFSAACSSLALLAFALAGCGGGGGAHSALVPPTNGGQSATSPPLKSGVTFTIVIPKESASTMLRRPAYVSPATQSMTLSVTGTGTTANPAGFPMTVGLTPSSSDCTSSLAGTTCTVALSLSSGKYKASISTFDGANGAGNELSTDQGVAFTVTANANNVVPMTLSGIPAQIDPTYLGSGKFMVVALDADNNYIVGAGAPTFTVAKSGSGSSVVTITQPTTAAPNAFSIAASTTLGSETLTITAGYPAGATSGCAQTGAVCTTSFAVSNSQTLFAADYYNSSVLAFSVPFASSSDSPLFTYYDYYPYGGSIALDPSNGNVFFSEYEYDSSYPIYEVTSPYTESETALLSADVAGLAVDSNHNLFVSSYTSNVVSEYAPPYTGAPIGTFSSGNYPWAIALDASNDLFVGNYDTDYVQEYPYSSGSYGAAVDIPTPEYPYDIVVDPSGDLWVASDGTTIQEFKPPFSSSSTASVTIDTDLYYYCTTPMVFDSSGDLFVSNYGTGAINEYTKSAISGGGTIASPSFTIPAGAADYSCMIGVDASGNVYSSTESITGGSDGAILEFSPPFSNSSTPAYTITSGVYYPYYNGGVITKAAQLKVTL